MTRTVLFICTGNYYRSRYAELLFNAQQIPGWRAESRGLALSAANRGPIWPMVLERLQQRGLPLPAEIRSPLALSEHDLARAALTIALDETEHRPLMQRRFPQWRDRIDYWQVPDLHLRQAEYAFMVIEAEVAALIQSLPTR